MFKSIKRKQKEKKKQKLEKKKLKVYPLVPGGVTARD